MDPASASPNASHGRSPAPRLGDLADQLLVTRLLRAGAVAARPERIVAGFVAILVISVVGAALNGPVGEPGPFGMALRDLDAARFELPDAFLRADLPALADRARMVLLDAPRSALETDAFATIALALVTAAAWGLAGLWIARGAAMELGRQIHVRTRRLVVYLRVKGGAAVLALLLAPLAAGISLLVPLLLGLLLGVPGLDAAAGLVYGLGLVASSISAFLLLAWLVASWMLLPAVACDGADAFDATQRAFGMLLGRPVSVLAHALVAVVQGVVLVGIAWIIADLSVGFAGVLAGATGERASDIVSGAAAMREDAGSAGFAAALVGVWNRVPFVLAASYAVSYAHTASVAVYLNARKMVDGQEHSELWMPGDAAGLVAITPPGDDHEAGPAPARPDGDRGSAEPPG